MDEEASGTDSVLAKVPLTRYSSIVAVDPASAATGSIVAAAVLFVELLLVSAALLPHAVVLPLPPAGASMLLAAVETVPAAASEFPLDVFSLVLQPCVCALLLLVVDVHVPDADVPVPLVVSVVQLPFVVDVLAFSFLPSVFPAQLSSPLLLAGVPLLQILASFWPRLAFF